jgi:NitT/TauT family transport system ATP-binding protein
VSATDHTSASSVPAPAGPVDPNDVAGYALDISDVRLVYQSPGRPPTEALHNINLRVRPGEFVVLLGPSGCGKTTLLRACAGLERPTEGTIRLFDAAVTGPTERASFMFQGSVLLPWRTVLDNVLLPAKIRRISRSALRERALSLLEMAGLKGFENHYPKELSGGMRQRAAICRSLLLDPPVLFMDEPFGALDALTRATMNQEIYRTWAQTRKTILFVTHDIAEAVRLATRIVVMTPRPGRIEDVVEVSIDAPSFAERVASPEYHRYIVELEDRIHGR